MAFPSPFLKFHVVIEIPKDIQASCAHFIAGHKIVITAPITLKPEDDLLVDIRNGNVHEVARGGIIIWRATCLN